MYYTLKSLCVNLFATSKNPFENTVWSWMSYRGPTVIWSAAHYDSATEWLREQGTSADHTVQPPGRPGSAKPGCSVGFYIFPGMQTLQPLWRPLSQCSAILILKRSVQIEFIIFQFVASYPFTWQHWGAWFCLFAPFHHVFLNVVKIPPWVMSSES